MSELRQNESPPEITAAGTHRMSKLDAYEQYRALLIPDAAFLAPCPVCGAPAGLWRYSVAPDAPTTTVVMCSNEAPIGPQDGRLHEGCLLYMPSDDFYRATIREAVRHWNDFATALVAQRQQRATDRDAAQDRWARSITQLADDHVVQDPVRDLLVALKRAGKISSDEMAALLIKYLREKQAVG